MRHNLIGFNDRNTDIITYVNFSSFGTNHADIEQMKHILKRALLSELTLRQRECVTMYYYDNMKMREIASLLSLNPSTVTRHIKAALRKLQNVARYY